MRSLIALSLSCGLLYLAGCGGGAPPGAGGAGTASTSDVTAAATSTTGAGSTAPVGGGPAFVQYANDSMTAAVIVHPAKILASPLVKQSPADGFAETAQGFVGFHPADLEVAALLVEAPHSPRDMASGGLYVKFSKPTDIKGLLTERMEGWEETEVAGKKCWTNPTAGPKGLTLYTIDDRSALVALPTSIEAMLTSGGKGPLADRLRTLDLNHDVIAVGIPARAPEMMAAVKDELGSQVPPDFQKYFELLDLTKSAALTIDLQGGDLLGLVVEAKDAGDAAKINELLASGVAEGQAALPMIREEAVPKDTPAEAFGNSVADAVEKLFAELKPTASGSIVTVKLTTPEMLKDVPKLIGEVEGAMAAAQSAAEGLKDVNNVKQVALAVHIHESQHAELPWYQDPKSEKPAVSWRVKLLPYIERRDLYDQYKFDEPWDSENNLKVAETMPAIYRTSGLEEPGMTGVQIISAKEPLKSFADIKDGTSNTLMVVVAGPDKAVPWTKPQDIDFDPETGVASFGELAEDELIFATYDGAVRTVPAEKLTVEIIKALVTPSGEEAIDWSVIDD